MRGVLGFLIGLVLFSGIVSAQTTNISTCQELNISGYYQMTADIIDYNDTCFTIRADNITLDCQGHTIDGDDTGIRGVWIDESDNIIIMDCRVTDFLYGFMNTGGDYATFIRDVAESNSYGFDLTNNPTGNIISNSTSKNNNDMDFIAYLEGDVPCRHEIDLMVTDDMPMVYINGTTTIDGLSNTSLLFLCNVDGSTINNVSVESSLGNNGIMMVSSENVQFTNIFINNTRNGLYFWECDENTVDNLESYNNRYGLYGIYSSLNEYTNIVVNNNLYGVISQYQDSNIYANMTANYNDYFGVATLYEDYTDFIETTTNYNGVAVGYNGWFIWGDNGVILSLVDASYNGCKGIQIIESYDMEVQHSTANYNMQMPGCPTPSGAIHIEDSDNISTTYSETKNNPWRGVSLIGTNNSIVRDSIIENSSLSGFYLDGSTGNVIYNNLINNTNNVEFGVILGNDWNTTRQAGVRIYSSGTEIGGNYWTHMNSSGYSDICIDFDDDGFCDETYVMNGNNKDFLSLSGEYVTPTTTTTVPVTTTTTVPVTTTTTTVPLPPPIPCGVVCPPISPKQILTSVPLYFICLLINVFLCSPLVLIIIIIIIIVVIFVKTKYEEIADGI